MEAIEPFPLISFPESPFLVIVSINSCLAARGLSRLHYSHKAEISSRNPCGDHLDSGLDEDNQARVMSPLAYITFSQVWPLIQRAKQHALSLKDFLPLDKGNSANQLSSMLTAHWEESENPSLLRALAYVMRVDAIKALLFGLLLSAFKIVEIAELYNFLEALQNKGKVPVGELVGHAFGVILAVLLHAIFHHQYFYVALRAGVRMRVALTGFLYRKIMLADKSFINSGQVLNLISNDVQRFEDGSSVFAFAIIGPVESIVILGVIWRFLGIIALAGYGCLALLIPLNTIFARRFSRQRKMVVTKRDDRVGLLESVISFMDVVKMYTWEQPMIQRILGYRTKELKYLRKSANLKAFNESLFFSAPIIIGYVTFGAYFLVRGESPASTTVVTVLGYLSITRMTMYSFFPKSIEMITECSVSLSRLETLLHSLKGKPKAMDRVVKTDLPCEEGVSLSVDRCAFAWPGSEIPVLKDVTLTLGQREHLLVAGQSGSAKSSLLLGLLDQIDIPSGSVHLNGRASYSSQVAWLFNGTIQENIIFGLEYDEERFKRVIRACALEDDLRHFPEREHKVVEERGANLSGGQQARINLARAVYADADIYLLDDPLSAVDSRVAWHIIQECIHGFLKDKAVVLVTHQLQYANEFERIALVEGGTVSILHYTDIYPELSPTAEMIYRLSKAKDSGTNETQVVPQEKGPETEKEIRVTHVEEKPAEKEKSSGDDAQRSGIPWSLYWVYFRAGTPALGAVLLLILLTGGQIVSIMTEVWLLKWTGGKSSTDLIAYTVLAACTLLISSARSAFFFYVALSSAANLFKEMLSAVIYSPVSFFRDNEIGSILNRLTKDQTIVEEMLPLVFFDFVQCAYIIAANVFFACSNNYYAFIVVVPLAWLFIYYRRTYLAASRQIKRLEAQSRGPVYSQLSCSLQGLSTIRAAGAEQMMVRVFEEKQDRCTNYTLHFILSSRWLGFRLDQLAVALLAFCVILSSAINLGDSSMVGLALTYIIQLMGVLQWCTRQSAEVENMMVSVERIHEYTKLEPEGANRVAKICKDKTCLIIAHRLKSVLDLDKVLVLDAGRVVEFDTPKNLLDIENGHFNQMVKRTNLGITQSED
ncbi:uncharacterized protein VTP21DRAFT_737 [Calcarisporiella thermophila]|uniref:uncharacterized protein n=1 Tax=Calcarisporiella thermophila TaxID=911321 RepID=UPI0037438049